MNSPFDNFQEPESQAEETEVAKRNNTLFYVLAVFLFVIITIGIGLTVCKTSFKQQTVSSYRYDFQAGATRIVYSDGTTVTFNYGNQKPVQKLPGMISITYDANGQKVAEPSNLPAIK